jgi:crotonobetainyl-CoA:carnitine CoA-transferase CaiB-like acyl-CoA transferase
MKEAHLDIENTGPLKGIKIVDLSSIVMGPYGSALLGDLGADVIKVENLGGDLIRLGGKSPTPRMGPIYMRLNRNKKSLELNLKKDSAKEAMLRLLKDADVFFTNVRGQGLKRLGLSYGDVKAVNPKIIYTHCTGFNSEGPYAGRQALDDIVQAASGLPGLLPLADGHPEMRYVPMLIGDKSAALHAVYATIAALFHRERTGEGQFVEVPLFESFVSFNLVETMYGNSFVPPLGSTVYPRSVERNRKPFKAKNGYVAIVPYSDTDFIKFFDLAGHPEIMEDPRYQTFTGRIENIDTLYGHIAEVALERTVEEWEELCAELNIPCMPVRSLDDITDDRHLKATDFFQKRQHPTEGEYIAIKHPVRFEKTPAVLRHDPPKLGQHNKELLSGLGYTDEQTEDMGS